MRTNKSTLFFDITPLCLVANISSGSNFRVFLWYKNQLHLIIGSGNVVFFFYKFLFYYYI